MPSTINPVAHRDSFRTLVEACCKLIDLAPEAAPAFLSRFEAATLPEHRGFEQLADIHEKLGGYEQAIRLDKEALRQEWAGQWEARIARCEKKLANVAKPPRPA
jgi:hypothetical protein